MRKVIPLIAFFLLSVVALAQQPEINVSDKIAFTDYRKFLKEKTFRESGNYHLTDLVYQRLKWEIDPNILYIKGEITSYFKSLSEQLSEMEFDLENKLHVDSVVYKGVNLDFSRADDKIKFTLPTALALNQIDSVKVYYQGAPLNSAFGSFSKGDHNGIPIIWTLSEPYGAMEWWPCKQSLQDKIDSVDIIVTSPKEFRTASIGVLQSEEVANDKRTMHWKHRYPIATYLVAIAVTNYADYSDFLDLEDGRKIEILNYVYPEDLQDAKEKTPITADIMRLFNNLIGEYPFADEKYGHAQFGWGGGMEHQTMSFMNNFSYGLIAHELAHQWFGDYITLGSWQDIWLNEGFATYLTGISIEHLLPGDWRKWKKWNIDKITEQTGGSVFVSDTTNVARLFSSRLSYSKGAYLLHMLRWTLGDEAFYSGIRNYFNDPLIANGFARSEQFIEHMENVADTSLTEFFDDWLYGEGYPVYSVKYANAGNDSVKITLSQIPSHNSVDFFEMPVPVRLYNINNTDSVDIRLNHTKNEQEFVVNTGFKVANLKIDPDYWLVSKTTEIVLTPWIASSDDILIYPNPFSDMVSLFLPPGEHLLSTKIYSIDGKLKKEFHGNNKFFQWSFLKKGVYIIEIETSKQRKSQKLVKY